MTQTITDVGLDSTTTRRTRRRRIVWGTGSVMVGALIGAWGHLGFVHFFLMMGIVPAGVLMVLAACIPRLTNTWFRPVRFELPWKDRSFVVGALLSGVGLTSFVVGRYCNRAYLRSAKAWCEAQVPAIESFRAAHGRYPATLEEVVPKDTVPWVVDAYSPILISFEDRYVLDLSTSFLSGWTYSKESNWVRYH